MSTAPRAVGIWRWALRLEAAGAPVHLRLGGGENWVEGRGALGSPFSNTAPPPPTTMCSRVCLLTAPGRGGSKRVHHWGGGGALGTPSYTPQNDPNDAPIILNIHKRFNFFQKKVLRPSASGKNKRNWLLDLGGHFLNLAPGAPEPPLPPAPTPQSKLLLALS